MAHNCILEHIGSYNSVPELIDIEECFCRSCLDQISIWLTEMPPGSPYSSIYLLQLQSLVDRQKARLRK